MAGLPDIKKLEGRPDNEGEEGRIKPREFFWDSIVLYVLLAIIGLTAIDVVTEYIRGSGVQCFLDRMNQSLDSLGLQGYINDYCSGSIPMAQYFPVFIIVHGSLMAIPHYLWLNHFGGNFDSFFKLASYLELLRNDETGEYCPKNFTIVRQLDTAFGTYKQNWMYRMYVSKLVIQWLFTVVGFCVVIAFFTEFSADFDCPHSVSDVFDKAWPLAGEQVVCVFTSLRLLELIRIADLILIALVIFCLSWALIWCISTHPTELGSKNIAIFSFQTGLPPESYAQKLYVPRCLKPLRKLIQKFFTTIPWLSLHGPWITTDMDFLVLNLFRTDGSLGQILKEMQILQRIKSLNNDERRRFNLHKIERATVKGLSTIDKDIVPKELITSDIGWEFVKDGVFKSVSVNTKMYFPDSIRGVVLGFASRALKNESAVVVTFGSPSSGFTDALGRAFRRVGSINFSPHYKNPDNPVAVNNNDPSGIVSLTCSLDQLSTEEGQTEFLKNAGIIWYPRGYNKPSKRSNFVVLGPIKDQVDLTTANLLVLWIVMKDFIADDAVLLVMQPLDLNGKDVMGEFEEYSPPDAYFSEQKQFAEVREKSKPKWPPVSTKEDSPPRQSSFDLTVLVGDTHSRFLFSMYKRKSDPDNSDPSALHSASEHSEKPGASAAGIEVEKPKNGDEVKPKHVNTEHVITLESNV